MGATPLSLADFIERDMQRIMAEWVKFAASVPAAAQMNDVALRDHAEQILQAIAKDLRTAQTRAEQKTKSQGGSDGQPGAETAAQTHALLRATSGFTIRQLVAEYRALRASVLRLWSDDFPHTSQALEDIGRFNEAIDQAIAESVDFFVAEVDRWRHVFLGVLGHDLRGPLNAILMTSRVLSAAAEGTPRSQHTDRLLRSGERMHDLLNDLLDYSRTSLDLGIRVAPRPCDLAHECREEVDLQRAALPAASIEFVSEGSTHGTWDPSRIRQLLGNLVGNAAKFGDPSEVIRVSLRGDDDAVQLRVANRGPEIPKPTLDSLFEPLHHRVELQTKGERTSLGLGLFIVRQIARAHEGSITATSSGGETRFTVVLPKRLIA